MEDNYTVLKVSAISFDTDNPRIKMALEKYGDQLNDERIHFALHSATDGDKSVSSYSSLKDSILANRELQFQSMSSTKTMDTSVLMETLDLLSTNSFLRRKLKVLGLRSRQ